jgi:hypothetical protein
MDRELALELAGWLRDEDDQVLAALIAAHAGQDCEVCDALYEMLKDDE